MKLVLIIITIKHRKVIERYPITLENLKSHYYNTAYRRFIFFFETMYDS